MWQDMPEPAPQWVWPSSRRDCFASREDGSESCSAPSANPDTDRARHSPISEIIIIQGVACGGLPSTNSRAWHRPLRFMHLPPESYLNASPIVSDTS